MYTLVVIPRYGATRLDCFEQPADLVAAVDILDMDIRLGRASGEYYIFQSEPITADGLRQLRADLLAPKQVMTGDGDGV